MLKGKEKYINFKQSTSSASEPAAIIFPRALPGGWGWGGGFCSGRIDGMRLRYRYFMFSGSLRQVPSSAHLELPVGKQASRLIFCPHFFIPPRLGSARREVPSGGTRWISEGAPARSLMCVNLGGGEGLAVITDRLLIPLSERPDRLRGTTHTSTVVCTSGALCH